jgi:catechol 2,3-dioxygenase-like lactoylglutathione lyase family enzyme
MAISGYSHVGLTVTDLARSRAWYTEVLGWTERAQGRGDTTEFAHGVLPGGLSLVLRVHDQRIAIPFDEARPGLDHLSFSFTSLADIEDLEDRLTRTGSTFTPKRELPYGWLVAFRDPDNIALEAMFSQAG